VTLAPVYEEHRAQGVTFTVRAGTSDSSVVMGTFGGDEYALRNRRFTGWAIDLGSHIGVVAVALLLDNPDLNVIAVEPLPANLELVEKHLEPFGERAHIVAGAAGPGKTAKIGYEFGGIPLPEDYRISNRYIGKPLNGSKSKAEVVTVPVVTLAGLMAQFGIDEIAVVKTDCEGGEYAFFADPEYNARVKLIVGEYHDGDGSQIKALLEPTHDFVFCRPASADTDSTGLFEAVLR
jgi:FkbM family methyltransferase